MYYTDQLHAVSRFSVQFCRHGVLRGGSQRRALIFDLLLLLHSYERIQHHLDYFTLSVTIDLNPHKMTHRKYKRYFNKNINVRCDSRKFLTFLRAPFYVYGCDGYSILQTLWLLQS